MKMNNRLKIIVAVVITSAFWIGAHFALQPPIFGVNEKGGCIYSYEGSERTICPDTLPQRYIAEQANILDMRKSP